MLKIWAGAGAGARAPRADAHATGMLAMTCATLMHVPEYFIIVTHLVTMVGGANPDRGIQRLIRDLNPTPRAAARMLVLPHHTGCGKLSMEVPVAPSSY